MSRRLWRASQTLFASVFADLFAGGFADLLQIQAGIRKAQNTCGLLCFALASYNKFIRATLLPFAC